MVDKLNASAQP